MVNTKETEIADMFIRVNRKVYAWLESKKIHPRQPFNEVLENIMEDDKDV